MHGAIILDTGTLHSVKIWLKEQNEVEPVH